MTDSASPVPPNVSTFNTIHVEELWVGGKQFTKENFKGPTGVAPTIDDTLEKGDAGSDWNPDYDFKLITSPALDSSSVYTLPNPLAKDFRYSFVVEGDIIDAPIYAKTMMFLLPSSEWNAGATVSVVNHNNKFLGKFYNQTQNMKFMNADGVWLIC